MPGFLKGTRHWALAAMTALTVGVGTAPLPMGSALAADTVLHRGNGMEPETLDPHKSSGQAESYIEYDLFEGLLVPDGGDGYIPGAAERWEVSPDGLVYTFHLRPNGKWSDGTPVTAHDFVFSWRRVVDPATQSRYAHFLWPVKNAEEITNGKMPPDQLGVRAVDDYTFEVVLRSPAPYFLAMQHHHATYPLSQTNVTKFGADFIKPGNLVSNGAYKLAEAVPQSHVKLVKNPHFHDAANVQIDTVMYYPTENLESELKRFRSGELHITYEIPVSQIGWIRANMAGQMRLAPQFANYFFAPNMTKEPWKSNKDLRLAVNLAIDRAAIAEKIMQRGEKPIFSFVPPGTANYTPQEPDYASWTQAERDAKAKELIRKAGYGPGGKPLHLEILYNTHDNHRKVSIAVASMLQQKLGVKVTLNNQEWKVFLATRNEKSFKDITRHGWIGDYNDANNFLELLRGDVGKINPAGYANPEFDRLMAEANVTADPAKRRELMQQAERVMLADVPVFPIYSYVSRHMVSDKVLNWKDNLLDQHPSRFLALKP